MDFKIKTYKRLPDGTFEPLLHRHALADISLESAQFFAKNIVAALHEVARAEVISAHNGDVLFVWAEEDARA